MDVNFYAARAYAVVLKHREAVEAAYEYSEVVACWAFIDLKNSTNYRIARGAHKGYLRGETFFKIVHTVIAPTTEVRLIKEIGDAVLLSCPTFTQLFECVLLIDEIAQMFAALEEGEAFPFGVRAGIGFGSVNKLFRESEDFLGRPIDELSRVMGVRSSTSDILLHQDAYGMADGILKDYDKVVTIGEPKQISAGVAKGAQRAIYYREVVVNRRALRESSTAFVPWRKQRSAAEPL